MDQIIRDIKLPSNLVSKQYYDFIMKRLRTGVDAFTNEYLTPGIEDSYEGLYWLLTIAKDPVSSSKHFPLLSNVVSEGAEKMCTFITNQTD